MVLTPHVPQDAVDLSDAARQHFISKTESGCEVVGDDSTCDPDSASVSASTNLVPSTTPETEPADSEDLEEGGAEAYYEFLREMGCEFTDDAEASESDADDENEDCCGSSAEARTLETSPVLENKMSESVEFSGSDSSPTDRNDLGTESSPSASGYKNAMDDNSQMSPVAFTIGPSPWLLRAIRMAQEDVCN